jgi:hypothetical protein
LDNSRANYYPTVSLFVDDGLREMGASSQGEEDYEDNCGWG